MGNFFDTLEEYDAEIEYVRIQMREGLKAEQFRLNTSQSNQVVIKNVKGIRDYLTMLTTERQRLIERCAGASVTSLTYRRQY